MESQKEYPVPESTLANTLIDEQRYTEMYRQSIENPESFWSDQAKEFLSWDQPWSTVTQSDFLKGEAAWFIGGKLNVTINCIDRHLPERADQTAIIWEGDNPDDDKKITYRQLHSGKKL